MAARTIAVVSVSEAERARRPRASVSPRPAGGGYAALYVDHVLPASEGADFDFLVGSRRSAIPRQLF